MIRARTSRSATTSPTSPFGPIDALRGHQTALYISAGLVGSSLGLLAATVADRLALLIVSITRSVVISEPFTSILLTAMHFGIFSSVLGSAIFIAQQTYRRHTPRRGRVLQISTLAFLGGAGSAGLLQAVVNSIIDAQLGVSPMAIFTAGPLVGAFLGWMLSRYVPNLPPDRGTLAGVASGVFPAVLIILAREIGMPTTGFVPIIGHVALGATLGFALSMIERHFRKASIEVHWAAREASRIGLGDQAVTVGGGDDDIYIEGAPARVSSIAIRNGQIEHIETGTGKRTVLQDGSRLRIGPLTMVIHNGSAPSERRGNRSKS